MPDYGEGRLGPGPLRAYARLCPDASLARHAGRSPTGWLQGALPLVCGSAPQIKSGAGSARKALSPVRSPAGRLPQKYWLAPACNTVATGERNHFTVSVTPDRLLTHVDHRLRAGEHAKGAAPAWIIVVQAIAIPVEAQPRHSAGIDAQVDITGIAGTRWRQRHIYPAL